MNRKKVQLLALEPLKTQYQKFLITCRDEISVLGEGDVCDVGRVAGQLITLLAHMDTRVLVHLTFWAFWKLLKK